MVCRWRPHPVAHLQRKGLSAWAILAGPMVPASGSFGPRVGGGQHGKPIMKPYNSDCPGHLQSFTSVDCHPSGSEVMHLEAINVSNGRWWPVMPEAWADHSHCNVLVTVHDFPEKGCLYSSSAMRGQRALALLADAGCVVHALSLLGRTMGPYSACCCRLRSACAILARTDNGPLLCLLLPVV